MLTVLGLIMYMLCIIAALSITVLKMSLANNSRMARAIFILVMCLLICTAVVTIIYALKELGVIK